MLEFGAIAQDKLNGEIRMKKYIIYIAILAIVGFGFYKKIYIPKHTFKTTTPVVANMQVNVNGVGNVASKDIYKIGSIYGGKVLNFTIDEGSFVNKGTIIANIDSVDLQDKIDELKATIQKLSFDKQSAKELYNYQNEIYQKNKKLYSKHTISALDFIKYKTNKNSAKLKISSLDASILQAKSSIAGLKEKLKRYSIVSPISGYVMKKYISNYQIITPNQTLIDIVDPKDVWIATYIDTRISGDVKLGSSATIKLRSSNELYKGKVSNIKPTNNSVTNEREIDVVFDNLPIPFYLNEQAIINIKIKRLNDIIKIPAKVVTINNSKNGVWIAKNNIVKFKSIKILAHSKGFVAVDGIDKDIKIVVPDMKKKELKENMKIFIKE